MFSLKIIYNICINFTRGVFSDEWTNEAYIHSVSHLDNLVFRVDLFVSPPLPYRFRTFFCEPGTELPGSLRLWNRGSCFKYVCFLKPQNHLTCACMIEFLYFRLGPQSEFLFLVYVLIQFSSKKISNMFLIKILFVIELGLVWDLSKRGPGRTFLGTPQYTLSTITAVKVSFHWNFGQHSWTFIQYYCFRQDKNHYRYEINVMIVT